MERESIEAALDAAERALDEGKGLSGTGFWPAVDALKRSPELADAYADRFGALDRRAFENWAFLTFPIGVGTTLLVLGTALGLFLIGWSYSLTDWWQVIVFYVGVGALLTTTHGLGHLVVGAFGGMRFTHWFIGKVTQPQPGVKVDYSTYLRAAPKARAWMHAAGALATKLVPFLLIPAAVIAGLPTWAIVILPVLGTAMVVTDVAWSTKSSDWKKFRREMSYA